MIAGQTQLARLLLRVVDEGRARDLDLGAVRVEQEIAVPGAVAAGPGEIHSIVDLPVERQRDAARLPVVEARRVVALAVEIARRHGAGRLREAQIVERADAGIGVGEFAVIADQRRRHGLVLPAQDATQGLQVVVVQLVGAARVDVVRVAVVLRAADGEAIGPVVVQRAADGRLQFALAEAAEAERGVALELFRRHA